MLCVTFERETNNYLILSYIILSCLASYMHSYTGFIADTRQTTNRNRMHGTFYHPVVPLPLLSLDIRVVYK